MTRASVVTFDPAPVLARFPHHTARQIAEACGVECQTISTWRRGVRRLKTNQADRIACHVLGVHPAELWPEWGTENWLIKRTLEVK